MSRFFSHLNIQHFFEEYWNKSYYKFRTDFEKIDSKEMMNKTLASNIEYPDFRIIQRNGSITPYLYTKSDNNSLSNKISITKFKILDLTEKTIKITNLDQYVKEIGILVDDISNFFPGVTISVNGYFSGALSQGGSPHYDFYHIFAFQLSGKKKWKIGNIVESNPHKDFGHQIIDDINFIDTVTTHPGDVLYLPPGIWHDVSSDIGSVHLAIGIQTSRIFNLLEYIITDISKNNSSFRADLPLQFNNASEKVTLPNSEIDNILNIIKQYLQKTNDVKLLPRK